MKKIYYLSTCDTCKRILNELAPDGNYVLQDVKNEPVSEEQLVKMRELTESYEALFSKRARLYKERDLKNKDLSEEQIKDLILEHYTFLKRPVIIADEQIFIGNSRKTIEAAKKVMNE